MPSVEERLRYWRTRAQRMQVALEDIATDEVQSHSDDELGLIQRMQDTARGVLGDDPSEFDKLRAQISTLTAERDALIRERDEAREAALPLARLLDAVELMGGPSRLTRDEDMLYQCHSSVVGDRSITLGDMKRARSALSGAKDEREG